MHGGTDSSFNAKSVPPDFVGHELAPNAWGHRFCIQCKIGAQVCSVPGDRFWVIDLSSQFWRMVSPHRTLCSCSHQTLCICRPFVDSWVIDLSSEFWRMVCPHRTLCSGCHQTLCICTPLWIDQPCNSHGLVPRNTVYMLPPNSVDRSTMQPTWSGPTEHCVNVASVNDSYLNRRI